MEYLESVLLGILQGLTEFLPVSSSGHLEIGKALFGDNIFNNLYFTIVVHSATVLSTLVVFRQEIIRITTGFFRFQKSYEMRFVSAILISLIPVGLVGFFLADKVEALFTGRLQLVGFMLLITAALNAFAHYSKDRGREIGMKEGLVIGVAQAIAVIPGISRSGATIATGLLLGARRTEVARFSFLMVIIPVLGAMVKDLASTNGMVSGALTPGVLVVGFLSAFLTGLLACRMMVRIVQKASLLGFAVYCAIAGMVTILLSM